MTCLQKCIQRRTGSVEVVNHEYYGAPSIWELDPEVASDRSKLRNLRQRNAPYGGKEFRVEG
jgi:hypothetical protein